MLADAGFHVVAPFMRGYAPTAPRPTDATTSAHWARTLSLIDALGASDAVLFGHDWGAVAAYEAAGVAPKKIRKLITAAVPYGPNSSSRSPPTTRSRSALWYRYHFRA